MSFIIELRNHIYEINLTVMVRKPIECLMDLEEQWRACYRVLRVEVDATLTEEIAAHHPPVSLLPIGPLVDKSLPYKLQDNDLNDAYTRDHMDQFFDQIYANLERPMEIDLIQAIRRYTGNCG